MGPICRSRHDECDVCKMKNSYKIHEVVKILFVETDKAAQTNQIHFDFTIMILKTNDQEFEVKAYREETLEVKTLSGDCSHDEMLVRDYFLVDDRLRFKSEAEATDFITKRLDEVFG